MSLAIGIFLTALYIEEALEFSAFPAFVLIATLLRLSLNVATTRLILLHGNEGNGAAGSVVEAFGRFVVEGNVLVGLVVFLILVVINFVVVTKGSGRVAEVAARFTLDAMPGKQMAIDADLAGGLINPEQARVRRNNLEREADFFGAMDGASKFVHGDAVAGLLITAINLIGGLILGVSRGMDIGQAAETFSVLSVGDALVSQVPALLISAAAGVVVTRSATGEQLGRAFATQLFARQKAVTMTAGILTVLAFMPGMPAIPCLALAGTIYTISRRMRTPTPMSRDGGELAPVASKPTASEEVDSALSLDLLTLEVGYELVGMLDPSRGGTLLDRVAALRQQIVKDLGVVIPPVHVCDNLELPPGGYRLLILGNPVGDGECRAGRLLAIATDSTTPPIDGEVTRDPTFGMPARWIAPRDKEMAEALGYAVVDHATIMATHMAEILRSNAHKLIGRQEAQHLLDVLARKAPKLVDDVIPNLIALGDLVRVLRNLVRENVSIRDMRTILESLAEFAPQTKDPEQITEMVRERLAPHITNRLRSTDGTIIAMALDNRLEDVLRKSLRDIVTGNAMPIDPEVLRNLSSNAEASLGKFSALGAPPTLIAPPDIRRYVRAVFERKLPQLSVVSFREIEQSVPLKIIETLAMASGGPSPVRGG
jgi:flagellar biosynthesis protein FlhA